MKAKSDSIVRSKTTNVFAELGFEPREAQELKRKSDLMMQIEQFISRRGLTQAKAAAVLGVSQPRVSALLSGRLSLFSTDELIRMYEATGSTVTLTFKRDAVRERSIVDGVLAKGDRKHSRRARV